MIFRRVYSYPTRTPARIFGEWDRMHRQVNRLMDHLWGEDIRRPHANVFPPMNLSEDVDNYRVRAELPGVQAEDLDIQVTGNSLAVTGERKRTQDTEKVRYHRREREAGKFSRVIKLPGDVDGDNIQAKLKNGILTLVIPKAEASKPRQISVH